MLSNAKALSLFCFWQELLRFIINGELNVKANSKFLVAGHRRLSKQAKGGKQFLVKLLTFSKSLKAYHAIKTELKPLSRAYGEKKTISLLSSIMWKLNFNFETNFLQFLKTLSSLDGRFEKFIYNSSRRP